MKKIFYATLIISTILTGAHSIIVQAITPTNTEISPESQKSKKNPNTSSTEEKKETTTVHKETKAAPDTTAKDDTTSHDDTTIPPEIKHTTLKKFNILSHNLEAAKEYNEISTLYPMISYWDPIWTRCIREHPGKLYYCPTAEAFMLNIPDIPYINASCVPNKKDCRYIITAEPYNKETQLDYIKLLIHIQPQTIISLVNNIPDKEQYSDENFCVSQTANKKFNDIVSSCTLNIFKSDTTETLATFQKIYVQWPMLDSPISNTSIVELIRYVKNLNSSNKPIVIQSTSGNGRPSCLTAILLAYDEMTKTDLTTTRNIPEILSYIAQIRCMDIYFTKEQYILIYYVVNQLAHTLPYTPSVHKFLIHHNLDSTFGSQIICCLCKKKISDDELIHTKTFPACHHKIHKTCDKNIEHCPHCHNIY